jgi:IPT/TIG domain
MATPVITALSPTTGTAGTHVQITGSGFVQGGFDGVVVFTNNVNATTVLSYTNTSIVVAVPAGAVTGNVFIEFPHVNSNSKPFTVTTPAVPNISSLNPSNGGVGIKVTINGTNFGASQGSSFATLNGTTMMITSWTATAIVATVPLTAATGPVIVTVGGVASNSLTFTVTNPSHGGTSTPLGFLIFPVTQFVTPIVMVLDPTNFNEISNGSFYSYKVEEVAAGRTPTCSRQIITYRDLGIATITATLSGSLSPVGAANTPQTTSQTETFQIGTAGATQSLFSIVRGLNLSAQNLQYTITRQPDAGPVSIIKTRLEGRVELTAYA